jgi:microcystin-dependent protein
MPEIYYVGEIRLFAHGVIPKGWLSCDGQLIPVSTSNLLLRTVIGNRFGGDGINNFGLPNLNGRAPMGVGTGPALTTRELGNAPGEQKAYMEIGAPAHLHYLRGVNIYGDTTEAEGHLFATAVVGSGKGKEIAGYAITPHTGYYLGGDTVTAACTDKGHPNMQPYLALQFCIALEGLFPPRAEE